MSLITPFSLLEGMLLGSIVSSTRATILEPGDVLLVLADEDSLTHLREALQG